MSDAFTVFMESRSFRYRKDPVYAKRLLREGSRTVAETLVLHRQEQAIGAER